MGVFYATKPKTRKTKAHFKLRPSFKCQLQLTGAGIDNRRSRKLPEKDEHGHLSFGEAGVPGDFSTLDYSRLNITITGISITVSKLNIRGSWMVTGGMIGLIGGFLYAYQNSAGRLMGFFSNENDVKRYKK